ncbi:MAG: hypothetical protein PHS44_07945, partial [Candidatus Dojkabacteria bacterium]|nr:hypothetical protein [Candidatus Dojkabacteria bacterium]
DPITKRKTTINSWIKTKLAYAREEFPKWSRYLYFVGFGFSIITTAISPMLYNFAVLTFYVLLGLVYLFFAIRFGGGKLYDSKSKKGIVGGFVRLFDAKQNKLIDNQITDKTGRYSFIAESGKYNLLAAKEGYTFPSKDQKDLRKTYYGSLVNVNKEKKGVIGIDLAMDPVSKKEMDLKKLKGRGRREKFGSPFSA